MTKEGPPPRSKKYLREWRRISKDGIPSSREIDRLYGEEKTQYRSSVYARKFGSTEETKSSSYLFAVDVMQQIVNSQEETQIYP